MSIFAYSKLSGKNDPMYGKYEHKIIALIEDEARKQTERGSSLDFLFNVESSHSHSEAIMGQSSFDTFMAKEEGAGAENDNIERTYDKTISHTTFAKEFTITKEMADDAKFGIGANMKARPAQFTRAYFKTRTKLAEQALINGIKPSMVFNRAEIDLTAGDKLPLFHKSHLFSTEKMKNKTQSNYYYCDSPADVASLESIISILANKLRNMLDENGDPMGYIADTIIIPANRPGLEAMVKKVIGSERTTGTNHNDINLQYGNWNLVVLNSWQSDTDVFMIMSREANENLMGNMFFNRVKLDVTNYVDNRTRNFIWNGYCRLGIGFTTYKHIMRCEFSTAAVTNATKLEIA